MRKTSLITLFLLGACTEPATIFKPVTVEIPVAEPCRTQRPETPLSPLAHMHAPASLFEKTKAALTEIELRKAYESELESTLQSCQQPLTQKEDHGRYIV